MCTLAVMPESFSLDEHLRAIASGRAKLAARLRALIDERTKVELEIQKLNDDIARIDAMGLPAPEADPAPEPRTRPRVLDMARAIVRGLPAGWHEEGALFAEAECLSPGVHQGSVRSALSRLVEQGEVQRSGKRGSRVYARIMDSVHAMTEGGELERLQSVLTEVGADGLMLRELAWKLEFDPTRFLAHPSIEMFVLDGETRYRLKPQVSMFPPAQP